MDIQGAFRDLVLKCCKKNAAELKLPIERVNIQFSIDEFQETAYKIGIVDDKNGYPAIKPQSFLELLGVKIPFGMNLIMWQIVPPFVFNKIVKMSEENRTDVFKTKVCAIPAFNEETKEYYVCLYLFEGERFIKYFWLEELLDVTQLIEQE